MLNKQSGASLNLGSTNCNARRAVVQVKHIVAGQPGSRLRFGNRRLKMLSTRQIKCLAASADSTAASPSSNTANQNTVLTYTSYEGNSWRVEFASSGVKVLVDPWLVDTLTFGTFNVCLSNTRMLYNIPLSMHGVQRSY